MNFNDHEVTFSGPGSGWRDGVMDQPISGTMTLRTFEVVVASRTATLGGV